MRAPSSGSQQLPDAVGPAPVAPRRRDPWAAGQGAQGGPTLGDFQPPGPMAVAPCPLRVGRERAACRPLRGRIHQPAGDRPFLRCDLVSGVSLNAPPIAQPAPVLLSSTKATTTGTDGEFMRLACPRPGRSSKIGAPDTIRTCDLCLRRATLYPAELRVRLQRKASLAERSAGRKRRAAFQAGNLAVWARG